MATPFRDIYERAVFRFRDYDSLKLTPVRYKEVLQKYLLMAIADIKKTGDESLTQYDLDAEQFNSDLNDECVELLALGISYHWLSAKILDSEKLRNSMSTKEYSFFSPANLLRESQDLLASIRKEFTEAVMNYTYYNGDIATMSV